MKNTIIGVTMIFADRSDAGKKLAEKLLDFRRKPHAVVLGLPRGGVVVAYEIAVELGLPLDIIVVRKIGAPDNPEFAIGAVTESGQAVFDQRTIDYYEIGKDYIAKKIDEEMAEAKRRLNVYRQGRKPLRLKGKIVILVDDGVATGHTMRAAIAAVKSKGAEKVIVAVPVIAPDTMQEIQKQVDELIYLDAPDFFGAVGEFYREFFQTGDDKVIELMKK